MLNREDMMELTRRMTPERTCFDRIAGAYMDEYGEVDESYNIHFGKLPASEKTRTLELAKAIPFSDTNRQLELFPFKENPSEKDSMRQLLTALIQCGLKNDGLMEVLYEVLSDGYPVDYPFAITVFHGVYDIPRKAKDKESLWESEEVYDFLVVAISPMAGEYEPAMPDFGFLYPAFVDRSADKDHIAIYRKNPEEPQQGLMYKLLGKCERE